MHNEFGEKAIVNHTLVLSHEDGNTMSTLGGYFGRQEVQFDGIASLDQVKPFVETYVEGVCKEMKALRR